MILSMKELLNSPTGKKKIRKEGHKHSSKQFSVCSSFASSAPLSFDRFIFVHTHTAGPLGNGAAAAAAACKHIAIEKIVKYHHLLFVQ